VADTAFVLGAKESTDESFILAAYNINTLKQAIHGIEIFTGTVSISFEILSFDEAVEVADRAWNGIIGSRI